jgi:hypothetical protein
MTWTSPRFNKIVPSYETATIIALNAGYGTELIAHLKANNLVNVSKNQLFFGFDKWRSAYPDIPSYKTYLANKRNSTIIATRKSHITFALGLKVAQRFNLTAEYHAAFIDNGENIPLWDWIKQYPHISITACHQILREAPITEWEDFRFECIEESGISPAMFALNTQHIVNGDVVQEHWDTDEFEPFPVQAALNIPISRSYESRDGLTWNRQKLLLGGAIYAFVSVFSGFFNAKPRIPVQNTDKFTFRKYESRRKHQGNLVVRPEVTQAACDRLVVTFDLNQLTSDTNIFLLLEILGEMVRGDDQCIPSIFYRLLLNFTLSPASLGILDRVQDLSKLDVTPDNYWEIVFAHPELIVTKINANGTWANRDVADGIPTIAILGKNPRHVSSSVELQELLPEIAQTGSKRLELYLDREEGNKIFRPAVSQEACDRLAANFDLVKPSNLTAQVLTSTIGKLGLAIGKIELTHQSDLIIQLDLSGEPIAPDNYTNFITPDNYWEIIESFPKLIPIGIAEGAKKALSLCTQGFPCVAILGITNWSVSGSSPRILLPELVELCQGGREIKIFFDMDDPQKIKTIRNVRSQCYQLAQAIDLAGGKPQQVAWNRELGKGIDDALVKVNRSGLNVAEWLLQVIADSRGFLDYERIAPMYELSTSRNFLADTQGNYIPFELAVKIQQISVLIADTGSGKTYRINEFIQKCKALGTFVVIFTPTNKMGKQAAKNFGLPHRNSHEDINQVITQARIAGGLVLCPDSIQHVLRYLQKIGQPYVVIFDEAAKVAEHITTGHTIKDRYSEVNDLTHQLVTGAQSLIIAEAKISENDIKFYEQISGKTAIIYRHKRVTNKRQIKMYKGALASINAAAFKDLCDALEAGDKVVIACDSQIQGETIHRMLLVKYPHLNGMRNDAHTSYLSQVEQLTTSPNEFLARYQLDYLIYSPACKAGWDLTGEYVDLLGNKHEYNFSKIYGFFTVLPTSDHIQMIARWRGYADIIIACPEFISLGKDEHFTKKSLKEWREQQINSNAAFCKISPPLASDLQKEIDELYVHNTIRNGLEKGIARYSLMRRLQDDGHTVIVEEVNFERIKSLEPSRHQLLQNIIERAATVRIQIGWEEAEIIAAVRLPIDSETDYKIAEDIERKEAPTPEERAMAKKIRLRIKFPRVISGNLVDFDNVNDVYYTIRKHGKLGNGADLHAKLSYIDLIAATQRDRNSNLLSEKIVAAHHLGYEYQRVKLLLESNILNLLDGEYCMNSPEIIALQAFCLTYAALFKSYFGFEFTKNKSPMEFWTVLVRMLGFTHDSRRETTGDRIRHYFIIGIEAARANLSKYSQRVEELEAKVLEQQALLEQEIAKVTELHVISTQLYQALEQSEQPELIDLRISRNPKGEKTIEEERVELSELVHRIERKHLAILEGMYRLDEQLDGFKRDLALARKRMAKWEGVTYELDLRPRLFAAAHHRLELLSAKLLNSPNNSPVDEGSLQKLVKVVAIQGELPLKLELD